MVLVFYHPNSAIDAVVMGPGGQLTGRFCAKSRHLTERFGPVKGHSVQGIPSAASGRTGAAWAASGQARQSPPATTEEI